MLYWILPLLIVSFKRKSLDKMEKTIPLSSLFLQVITYRKSIIACLSIFRRCRAELHKYADN